MRKFKRLAAVPWFTDGMVGGRFFRLTRAEPLLIEGRVVSRSRSLISVEVEFRREDGELVAKASGQQFVTPYPSA